MVRGGDDGLIVEYEEDGCRVGEQGAVGGDEGRGGSRGALEDEAGVLREEHRGCEGPVVAEDVANALHRGQQAGAQ